MIDLRRTIVAVKVKPSESRENDFHLALADYLYKELKYQGMSVSRRSITLKVKLQSKHQDKYDHIIIDCLEGKLYLRGHEVKDKFFGKLRRFEGGRASDAYHCVVQSATRIINRIKKLVNNTLNEDDEREIFGESIEARDLRKKIIRDLRKSKLDRTASIVRRDLRKKASIIIRDLRKRKPKLQKVSSIRDLRKFSSVTKKDLRKKAELIDGFMKGDYYIEVYKNPTDKEINLVKESNVYNSIRGIIDHSGDLYIWNYDVLHNSINSKLKQKIDVNYIRISTEKTEFFIYTENGEDINIVLSFINKFPQLFTNEYRYNVSGFKNIEQYNIKDEFYSYNELIGLLNKGEKVAMKRLIKKSEVEELLILEVDEKDPNACDSNEKNVYQKWEEFSTEQLEHLNRI